MAKKSIPRHSCIKVGRHAGHIVSSKGKHYRVTFPGPKISKKVLKTSPKIKKNKCSIKLTKEIQKLKKSK